MSNQLGTKPARVVSVALQEVDAIRLHAHRKEYKHPMPVIVMAGVTALEEGANPEYSWFDRLMGATCEYWSQTHDGGTMFVLEYFGKSAFCYGGDEFVVVGEFDTFLVKDKSAVDDIYYAGARHNCELVAAHLNSILREAEEKQS